jgi:hypothetical protein
MKLKTLIKKISEPNKYKLYSKCGLSPDLIKEIKKYDKSFNNNTLETNIKTQKIEKLIELDINTLAINRDSSKNINYNIIY